MANFNVHLIGAALVSGVVSSALAYTGLYSLNECVLLWVAGAFSGLLPDIDSDSSAALSWIFTLLGFMASLLMFRTFPRQSLVMMWSLMLGVFLAVRYGLMTLFMRLTRHRGAYHSWLAGCFTALSASYVCWHYLELSSVLSWGLGGLVLIGFVTHLVLDECYAVDLSGMAIKKSFGTALKPFSLKAWWVSAIFAVGCVWLWRQLPSPDYLVERITTVIQHKATWQFTWVSAL